MYKSRRTSGHATRGSRLLACALVFSAVIALTGCGHQNDTAERSASSSARAVEHSGSSSPSPTRRTPSSTTPPTRDYDAVPVSRHAKKASRKATRAYVAYYTDALSMPSKKLVRSRIPLTGSALRSLLTLRTEYASKHYRVVGKSKVVSDKVIRYRQKPTLLVVAVCLDNSSVRVVDRDGNRVLTSNGPERVWNLLRIVRKSGKLVVTEASIPSRPDC